MGLFDRFKKTDKKEKKLIPDNLDIDEEELRLKEIAINHKDRLERAQAADKISNEFVALDMAKTIKDRAIRLIAANKLKDEDLLRDAALNSQFFDVRSFAWERLGENNKSIAEMVINTKRNSHIDELFDKVVDGETLKWIAIEAIDKKYRTRALNKIDDAEILYDLVFKSKDNSIKKAAILKDSFVDEDILKKLAVEDKDEGVKKAAISKIKNEDSLALIAQSEDNAKVRSLIFDKIKNPEILKNMVLDSKKSDVKIDLINKMMKIF